MATNLILQGPADNSVNDVTWTDIPGTFNVTLTRSGPCIPAKLEVDIVADPADTVIDSHARWPPFLNLRLLIRDTANYPQFQNGEFILFIGRLDRAERHEGASLGPSFWHITARDWLSVLADNQVGIGKWISVNDPHRGVNHSPSDFYFPNYVGTTASVGTGIGGFGEYRKYIIEDLALNIVSATVDAQNNPLGLEALASGQGGVTQGIDTAAAPNSAPIYWSGDNVGDIPILDAIRNLASEDPWQFVGGPPEVDSLQLSNAGFPPQAGIGGDLQIRSYNDGSNPHGRCAEYIARGATETPSHFVHVHNYNDPNWLSQATPPPTAYIEQHTFAREGQDIFSRYQAQGRGNLRDFNSATKIPGGSNPTDGSQGVRTAAMETTWDPGNGYYRVRRTANQRQQTLVGTTVYKASQTEEEKVQARAANDAALAQLVTGANAASGSGSSGGLNQGSFTIPGPPVGGPPGITIGAMELVPGYTCWLSIPDVGIVGTGKPGSSGGNYGVAFTLTQVRYVWPEDRTTLTVSRIGFSTIQRQLLEMTGRTWTAQAGHSNIFTSGWGSVPPAGSLTLYHGLGVQNVHVRVDGAAWDGVSKDPNGLATPLVGTLVQVQQSGYDAAQGQNYGFYVSASDIDIVTINFNKWLAPNRQPGAGPGGTTSAWLDATAVNTIIRVTVTPS